MFSYSDSDLYCENVALADLATRVGTPAFVYTMRPSKTSLITSATR